MPESSWQKLKEEIIDQGLCTRCGSCVGLCENLYFKDGLGECLPENSNQKDCLKEILEACPGKEVSWPLLCEFVFNKKFPKNFLLGNYKNIYTGFACNPEVRFKGGSGGIISAILIFLMENKKIDGAVVLTMRKDKPYQAQVIIASSPKEILQAAQSKYSLSPVNVILREAENFKGNLAYVGLPCQVHSIRKLQILNHSSVKNIKYIISPFCGNILYFDSIKSFLKANKIKNLDEVVSLQYRAGEWPGRLEIKLKGGQIFSLKKFHANYLIPFFIVRRCLLCCDLTNEFADVSCGDAWAPKYEERGKGWSLIISRTSKGQEIIDEMLKEKILSLQETSEEEAINMESHGLDLKKRGAFIRINFLKKFKKATPCYDYFPLNVNLKRKLFEVMLDSLFFVASLKISKIFIEHMPQKFLGKIFEKVRLVWKKKTKVTKKKGLKELKFKINL